MDPGVADKAEEATGHGEGQEPRGGSGFEGDVIIITRPVGDIPHETNHVVNGRRLTESSYRSVSCFIQYVHSANMSKRKQTPGHIGPGQRRRSPSGPLLEPRIQNILFLRKLLGSGWGSAAGLAALFSHCSLKPHS